MKTRNLDPATLITPRSIRFVFQKSFGTRRFWKLRLAIILALALGSGAALRMNAAVEFSARLDIHATADFVEPLTPLGAWVTVGSYGRCWHPRVEADWRPYCEGEWVWTDCGWYWQSDEPWAWACYHYGSWIDDPVQGWCWVPDVEWAPAWVTWREGPDYIGWAPCGPHGLVLAAPAFVFVDVHHFHEPIRRHSVIVNNTTIINRTKVINNIRREDRDFNGAQRRVVVNDGPGVASIQRVTGKKVDPRPVREVVQQTRVPDSVRARSREQNQPPREDQRDRDQRRNERPTSQQPAPRTLQPSQPIRPDQPTRPTQPERPPDRNPTPAPTPPQPSEPPLSARETPRTEPNQPPAGMPQRPEPRRDYPTSPKGRNYYRTPPQNSPPPRSQPPEHSQPDHEQKDRDREKPHDS